MIERAWILDSQGSGHGNKISKKWKDGRVVQPFGFTLTDPDVRITRIRLFSKVNPIKQWPLTKDV
jgi:hypothetical protein